MHRLLRQSELLRDGGADSEEAGHGYGRLDTLFAGELQLIRLRRVDRRMVEGVALGGELLVLERLAVRQEFDVDGPGMRGGLYGNPHG